MNRISLIKDLTRDVLESESPEEVFLLNSYDPSVNATGTTAKGPQGFGGEVVIVLVLPYVYKFFDKFIERMGTRAADGTWDLVRKWFLDMDESPSAEIKTIIKTEFSSLNIPDVEKNRTIDAVILALSKKRDLISRSA